MITIGKIKKLLKNPIGIIKTFLINNIFGVVQLSYSSTGEDVILDWIMKKSKGIYVDIGGFDPIYGNNTYLFYKKGWNGINIEPNKKRINKFLRKRPKDNNLQIAIGNSNDNLDFYVFEDNTISTCDYDTAQRYKKAGHNLIEQYSVEVWTLEKLFDTYLINTEIDVVSIDAEGWDMDVLESNNWDKYKPNYIILETVEYAKNGINTWIKQNHIFDPYLKNKGYIIIAETGINTIYKKI